MLKGTGVCAGVDRRNAERLAGLLTGVRRYTKADL